MAQSEMSSECVDAYSRRRVLLGAAATAAAAVIATECPAAQEIASGAQYGAEELIRAATQALADTMQMLTGGNWGSTIGKDFILVSKDLGISPS